MTTNTVNCPVSNHFYFKADSKYLLRGNKISALLLQSTIIPLNETQFVSLGLCFESYNDFEVDRQLALFRVIFPVSNHFCNSLKKPSTMHLRYIFLFVSLITISKDEQDTSFYSMHCNKRSRPAPIQTLHFPLVGIRIGTYQQYKNVV